MPAAPRPEPSRLERTIKGAKAAGNIAGAVLPVFQREDLGKHVDYLIKEDPIIAEYVKRNPLYRKTLEETAKDLYDKNYGKYVTGAKLIDSWDRITSAVGGLAEVVPGIGQGISALEDTIELGPKLLYSGWYAKGTNDYASLPYFAAAEAASFIPVVGDFVDHANLYVDRARKTFRKRLGEEFLNKVNPGRSRTVQ